MQETHPRVYVVIPVRNRKHYTEKCLECLARQTYPNLEVVIIDDGSTDGTNQMISDRFPNMTVLKGDGELWWVGATNLGLEYVTGRANSNDFVLLMNNDLTFTSDLVELLVKTHRDYPQAIIGSVESREDEPGLIVHGGNKTNWWLAKSRRLNIGRHLAEFPPGHIESVSYVTGRGVLFPVPVIRQIGFYDTRFVHRGDNEYGVRAKKHGYDLIVAYDAIVYHFPDDDNGFNRAAYQWSDLYRYLFDERSYANIKNIYWNARLCSKNPAQAISYFLFGMIRSIGSFIRTVRKNEIVSGR